MYQGRALSQAGAGFSLGNVATVRGSEMHGPWPQASYKLTLGPADNHDIISMKLFQLMVEHTPEEENIDWTKIEPSVNFLKSPKGMFAVPPSLGLCRTGAGPGPALVPAMVPLPLPGLAVVWPGLLD